MSCLLRELSARTGTSRAAAVQEHHLQPFSWRSMHMSLQGKYTYAIQTAKDFQMQGGAEERDGKLYFKGTVDTQEQANKIWDAIMTIPDWRHEIIAYIK